MIIGQRRRRRRRGIVAVVLICIGRRVFNLLFAASSSFGCYYLVGNVDRAFVSLSSPSRHSPKRPKRAK
jgi:hypothetical protein